MKQIWKELAIAIFMALILPGILACLFLGYGKESAEESQETATPQVLAAGEKKSVHLTVCFRTDGETVESMDMDEYLVGVLLAEMPASFEDEAKCAQAVAARTFAQKAVVTGGKHGDGSVCGDSACCQAYMDPEDYIARGGSRAAVDSARQAVEATSGYVLTYEGTLIEATYFSCSGGSTEDAVAVWGTDFPYLRATDSPGEENATHYTDTVCFTVSEFQNKLGRTLTGKPESWLGTVTYTAGGGVASMDIGGENYTGTRLRTLLGLRSTAFTMTAEGDTITVTTKGFGHRVGMSQYGADAMAVQGSSFQEILAYYYRGTELTYLGDN